MSSNLVDLSREVSALRADMAQINTLVDRLDVTIEKLTEVSTNVSQLLAVQGSRLDQQERSSSQLSLLIEKRKDEVTESVDALHTRIDNTEDSLYKRIDSTEKDLKSELEKVNDKILAEIKAIREENKTRHEALNKKITDMERWMWLVTGGAAVVGFFLSKIVDVSKIFG